MEKQNFVYSVPINNPDRKENESSIYVTKLDSLNQHSIRNVNSLQSLLNERLKRPDDELLGERTLIENSKGEKVLDDKYSWMSTKDVYEKSRLIG